MARQIYNSSKVRISVDDSGTTKVFRITVDFNGSYLHANIPAKQALDISEAIYNEIPNEILEAKEKENNLTTKNN
jgi:hypothetical protein